jgi:hypothetical protein
MKKLAILVIAVLVLAMVLAPAAYAAKPVPQMLDSVDIGDIASEGGHEVSYSDWGPIEPTTHGGNWGGIGSETPPGMCRVVWHAAGDTTLGYATLTLDTGGAGFARHIVLRVLDGIADDSFNVYVKNPGGDWALVYFYDCDPSTSEYWVEHDIYSFPAGKGQDTTIEVKIEATGDPWSGFNTYGQLAVDWVEVYDH